MQLGTKLPDEEKVDVFIVPEGELNMYYGLIGSGKTYAATADIHELLAKGRVVYATWPIVVSSFDDRKNPFMVLKNLLTFNKVYYEVPCQKNFHYIDVEKGEVDGVPTFNPLRDSAYIEYLNTLNHCDIFIDEAWRVFDSYKGTDFSLNTRNLALVTRHKYRSIHVITQRPTAVQVTIRGNINRFYKCVKLSTIFGMVRFARLEYQEMSGETVNEALDPISVKRYWGRRRIFDSYNSFFYGDLRRIHDLVFNAWVLSQKERFIAFFYLFKRKK